MLYMRDADMTSHDAHCIGENVLWVGGAERQVDKYDFWKSVFCCFDHM